MGVNGGSTGRRWPRVTHAREHTTGAQWLWRAPSGSRYIIHACTAYHSHLLLKIYLRYIISMDFRRLFVDCAEVET